jgi:RNA polymerase sigma factor (sigma-70 family)
MKSGPAVSEPTRAGAQAVAQPCRLRLDHARERELRRRLRRWSRRFLGLPEAEFDDAYQGAWRKLLEAERRGKRTRNLEHAMRWGIHNTWLEECRRRRRRPTTPIEHAPDATLIASSSNDPGELVERLEAARYMFEAMGTLTDRQRRILTLRDVCELKPDEVCQRLHITRRTYRHDHAQALNAVCACVCELLDGDWCDAHRDLLVAYAKRRATGAQTHAAQRHLRNCVSCRMRVAAIRCGTKTASIEQLRSHAEHAATR